MHRMTWKRFVCGVWLLLPVAARSQTDSSVVENAQWEFAPRIRGAQAQVVYMFFIGSYGVCLDIDLKRDVSAKSTGGWGLRFSVDKTSNDAKNYLQIALSARASFVLLDWCGTDFYGGIVNRTMQGNYRTEPSRIGMLFGWDLRIGPEAGSYFGLLLKICGGGQEGSMDWGGLGFYAGWSH